MARTAAVLYLAMAILSAFSLMYVEPLFYVAGNAEKTVSNIHSSELMFLLGFLSNLIGQTIFLFLGHVLYRFLKEVNQHLARLMLVFVAVSVPITFVSMLFQLMPILLLNGDLYLSAFTPLQVQAQVMLYLELYHHGIYAVEIFWGLWLFPFGLLVYRSGFLPKILGLLLMMGCFGYLIECVVMFLFPDFKMITYPGIAIASIAEISFIFWCLIRGVRSPSKI